MRQKFNHGLSTGHDITRLIKMRNKADYEDTIFNLQKEAKNALMLAENIISELSKLTQ